MPGFYHGQIDGVFLSKYLSSERKKDPRKDRIQQILEMAHQSAQQSDSSETDCPFAVRPAAPADTEEMADLFGRVFETYPFPVTDPAYLEDTMESHIHYFCALDGDRIVAVSSCEMDRAAENVEMTDFATMPEYRKKGLAQTLLATMEQHMQEIGIRTFYTIARSLSPGINITFAKENYTYGGTLIKNTNICGKLESMNVWYKNSEESFS